VCWNAVARYDLNDEFGFVYDLLSLRRFVDCVGTSGVPD
jgi:hypothetical protein